MFFDGRKLRLYKLFLLLKDFKDLLRTFFPTALTGSAWLYLMQIKILSILEYVAAFTKKRAVTVA